MSEQRNDSRNDSHLPECDDNWMQDKRAEYPYCICAALRACEQRVREDGLYVSGVNVGYASGLDAARDAVAALPPSPLPERWGVRTAMNFRGDVLAAIDALRDQRNDCRNDGGA